MERYIMELKPLKYKKTFRNERGMSLIELMIAMVVLLVGIVGSMALIAYAIGGNGRSRQQSNATVIAQMVSEKISSQRASLSNSLSITDCTGTSTTVQNRRRRRRIDECGRRGHDTSRGRRLSNVLHRLRHQ